MALYHENDNSPSLGVPVSVAASVGGNPDVTERGRAGPQGKVGLGLTGSTGEHRGEVWTLPRGDVRVSHGLRGGVGAEPTRFMDLDTWERSSRNGDTSDFANNLEWALSKLSKIQNCETLYRAIRHDTCGAIVTTPIRCDCAKGCVKCARRRAHKLQSKYEGVLEATRFPMFLTLTMPAVDRGSLGEGSKKIWKSFRKLRQRKAGQWVKRWMASEEVTMTPTGWHIHLHIIIDAPGIRGDRWKALIDNWCKLVGGHPSAQDFRRADRKTVSKELMKYLAKFYELGETDLLELLAAYRGRPIFRTCKKWRIPEKTREAMRCPRCNIPYRRNEWESIGPYTKDELAHHKQGPFWADYYCSFEGGVVPGEP